MYNENIDSKLCDLAENAINKNEFFEYMVGEKDYKFEIKGNFNLSSRNEVTVMIKGLELYFRKNPTFDVSGYIMNNLTNLISSGNLNHIVISMEFITDYIYLKKTNQISFEIDLVSILNLLRTKLITLKNSVNNLNNNYMNNEEFSWGSVEQSSRFIERYTGHKVL